MKRLTKRQTKRFVDLWNKKNTFPLGTTTKEHNMRYIDRNIVTWNDLESPEIDLSQFYELLFGL